MQVLSSRVCSSTFENAVFERLNVGECGLWLNISSTQNTLVNLEMVACVFIQHILTFGLYDSLELLVMSG